MRKWTREEAVKKHRELWNEIANILSGMETRDITDWILKRVALENLGEKEMPLNNCYCCEYVQPYDHGNSCDTCPVKWGCSGEFCCDDSEFGDFKEALWFREYDLAREIALGIANLPEREV